MAGIPVDRTEDFRQCVKEAAEKKGLREGAMAKVVASLVMPASVQPDPFTQEAAQSMGTQQELHSFILGCRRDYLDPTRMLEADRDTIDQQFALLIKKCRQEIDLLQKYITEEGSPSTHVAAHRQGMVLILSEHLQALTKAVDRMRSARFQSVTAGARVGRRRHATGALEAAAGRRRRDYGKGPGLHGREEVGGRADAGRAETSGQGQSQGWEIDGSEEGYRQDGAGAAEQMQQQRIVEDEEVLAEELRDLQASSFQLEARMLEISKLNHIFSVNVLQQAEQIEHLYNEAVAAAQNIDLGNRELEKAIKLGGNNRIFLLLFFFVLPMALLFYDWYDRRKGILW